MKLPLKASEWWSYKIPPMLAVAYFALASSADPPRLSATWQYFAVYLVAVIGIAGFGHVLLDAFDVEEDRLLGKSNLWFPLALHVKVLLMFALVAASLLPWLLLPTTPTIVLLLGLEFAMFLLYAAPPARLKERGLSGIFADAMYAHVLPALWTWFPFSLVAGSRAPAWFPMLLGTWALAVGMRHLLHHQVLQFEGDTAAHTATAAVRRGAGNALGLIVERLLPLEIVLFGGMAVVMGKHVPLVPAGFLVYFAWQWFKVRIIWLARMNPFGSIQSGDRAAVLGTLFMSRFYERWLPLLILATLVGREPSYLPLLVAHALLFGKGLIQLVRDEIPLAAGFLRSRAT